MAFDAILPQPVAPSGGLKLLIVAFTIALHAIGVSVPLIQAIWHVEELSGPAKVVKLWVAAPPPPPPPQHSSSTKPKTKPIERKPQQIRVPQATAKVEPESTKDDAKEESGKEEQGQNGGVAAGVFGGVALAPLPPPPASTGPKLLGASVLRAATRALRGMRNM